MDAYFIRPMLATPTVFAVKTEIVISKNLGNLGVQIAG